MNMDTKWIDQILQDTAYAAAHEEELKNVILNVNLDMIGCIMGKFIACCTAEEKLVHFIEYFGAIQGFGIKARQDVYSSDSTPFADKGVPALSFARIAPSNAATIHNSYDTLAVMKAEQLAADVDFINAFVGTMANAVHSPVAREIPEKMKEKIDIYLVWPASATKTEEASKNRSGCRSGFLSGSDRFTVCSPRFFAIYN